MGLDAYVFCDCFERGRLKSDPPPSCSPSVSEDGSLVCGSDDLDVQIAFDTWLFSEACSHEDNILLHHRIGNADGVATLKGELERHPDRFPIFLSAVLYSGTHCGDFISRDRFEQLQGEVAALAAYSWEHQAYMEQFARQMTELLAAATATGHPICF